MKIKKFVELSEQEKNIIVRIARSNDMKEEVLLTALSLFGSNKDFIVNLFEKVAEWGKISFVDIIFNEASNELKDLFKKSGAISLSIEHDHRKMVDKLIEIGLDVNSKDRNSGRRALETAIAFCREEEVERLLNISNKKLVNADGNSYAQSCLYEMFSSIKNYNIDFDDIDYKIDEKGISFNKDSLVDDEKNTVFYLKTLERLINDRSIDVNNVNNKGETLRDIFCKNKNLLNKEISGYINSKLMSRNALSHKNIKEAKDAVIETFNSILEDMESATKDIDKSSKITNARNL